jgi:PilZ domain
MTNKKPPTFWQKLFGKGDSYKQREKRYKMLLEVYIKKDNQKHLIGYLTNISRTGARISVHNYQKIFKSNIKSFKILVIANDPKTIPVELPVELSWSKVWNKEEGLVDIGVKLAKNISDEEKHYLGVLLYQFTKK